MSNERNIDESFDSLEWTAFQYVSNELSPDQRAAFEKRLAEEQAARDAVVRQVELGQAVFAHFDATPVPPREVSKVAVPAAVGKWNRFSIALAVAASVALVGFFVWSLRTGDPASRTLAEEDQLLDAWVFTQLEQVDSNLEMVGDESFAAEETLGEDSGEVAGDADEDDSSWMYLALADLEGDDSDGDAPVIQN